MPDTQVCHDVDALKAQLSENGFFVIEGFLNRQEIDAGLNECLAAVDAAEAVQNPPEREFFGVHSLHAKNRIDLNRPMLNALEKKPDILALARDLIGNDAVSLGKLFQAYLPHQGHKQSWHTDSDPDDLPFQMLTFLLYMQDQTAELGFTRFVPGSQHRPITRRFDSHADLPGQVCQTVPAGTLCAFVSTVWHSATENKSDRPRVVFGLRFCRSAFHPAVMPAPHGRARHVQGFRRFGKPIYSYPNGDGSYPWPD